MVYLRGMRLYDTAMHVGFSAGVAPGRLVGGLGR